MRQFLATCIALSALTAVADRSPVQAQLELPLMAPENQPTAGVRDPRSLLGRPDADPDGWVPIRPGAASPRPNAVSAPPPPRQALPSQAPSRAAPPSRTLPLNAPARQAPSNPTLPLNAPPRQPPTQAWNTVPPVYPSTGYPALFDNLPAPRSPATRPPAGREAPRPPASWNSGNRSTHSRPPSSTNGRPPTGTNGRPPTYGSAPPHRSPPPNYRPYPSRQTPPGTRSPTHSRGTPQTARPSSEPESPWDLLQRWNPFR